MSSILSTLNSAKRALMAHQGAIAVYSNNISNVNTPGYARRRVDLSSNLGANNPNNSLSGGVDLMGVTSIRDQYIERQLRHSMSESEYFDTRKRKLVNIESLLGNLEETGLTAMLDKFWNSWQGLSNDPSSSSSRSVVRQSAQNLINRLHTIDTGLDIQSQLTYTEIDDKMNRVNTIISEIGRLNSLYSGENDDISEMQDHRGLILDELSELIGAEFQFETDNTVSVFIGGANVVNHDSIQLFETGNSREGGYDIKLKTSSGISINQVTGSIGALHSILENDFLDLKNYLDEFAVSFVEQVNEIHKRGFGADGISGRDFFSSEINGFGEIKLDETIIDNINAISSSSNGNQGDNQIALEIAELQTSRNLQMDGKRLGDSIIAIGTWIGGRLAEASDFAESANLALRQVESWRESISGVSLDEEMTNLVQSQQAFKAAAKIVSSVDEMMTTLLQMI